MKAGAPRRPLRRRDHPRPRATVIRGSLVVTVLALLGVLMLSLYNGVPTKDYEKVYVSAPIIGNLLAHDAVRVSGKRIGQVLSADIGPDGNPRLELQLDPGTTLPADTQVKLRANGLLGARYVELVPGKSEQQLAAGATITGNDASYTNGVPELLDAFDAETRAGLRETLRGLGAGMLTNGQGLNTTLKQASAYTPMVDRIMRSVLRRDGAAARLVPATDAAFVTLARNTSLVGPWTRAANDALQPLITERHAVRETLEQAPGALAAADHGLARGVKLLAAVRRLSGAAAQTLPPAPDAVRALAAVLQEGRGPVKRLRPRFLAQARAGLNAVWEGAPTLERLRPRLDELLRNVLPTLRAVSAHPCDITNAAAVLRSMTALEQTSKTGELGQAMGFRLQVVAGTPADMLGTAAPGDASSLVKRPGYPADCTYVSRPYPQFDDLLGKAGRK